MDGTKDNELYERLMEMFITISDQLINQFNIYTWTGIKILVVGHMVCQIVNEDI